MERVIMKLPDVNGKQRAFTMVVEAEEDGWLMGWQYDQRGVRMDRFRMVKAECVESRESVEGVA